MVAPRSASLSLPTPSSLSPCPPRELLSLPFYICLTPLLISCWDMGQQSPVLPFDQVAAFAGRLHRPPSVCLILFISWPLLTSLLPPTGAARWVPTLALWGVAGVGALTLFASPIPLFQKDGQFSYLILSWGFTGSCPPRELDHSQATDGALRAKLICCLVPLRSLAPLHALACSTHDNHPLASVLHLIPGVRPLFSLRCSSQADWQPTLCVSPLSFMLPFSPHFTQVREYYTDNTPDSDKPF